MEILLSGKCGLSGIFGFWNLKKWELAGGGNVQHGYLSSNVLHDGVPVANKRV